MKSLVSHSVIAISVLATLCAAFVPTQCHATTLYGGAEHSDQLPPLNTQSAPAEQQYAPPNYQNQWQQQVPQQQSLYQRALQMAQQQTKQQQQAPPTIQQPRVEWFMIPKWMAGSWTKRGDLTTSVTDMRTGVTTPMNQWTDDEMTRGWGHQMDKAGNVWHADLIPTEVDSRSFGRQVRFVTVALVPISADGQKLITRARYQVSESNGRQIVQEFQQESLSSYLLMNDGELQVQSSNRMYDLAGRPTRNGTIVSQYKRAAQFQPIASLSGIDLTQSLNQFLTEKGYSNLIR